MTRSPRVTITMASSGAFSTGLMIRRSMRRPPTKAMTSVAQKATQSGTRACSMDQGRGEVRAEHRHRALGEIHDVGRLVDHDEREGQARVDAAGGEPGDHLLDENIHYARRGAPPPFRSLPPGRVAPAKPALETDR